MKQKDWEKFLEEETLDKESYLRYEKKIRKAIKRKKTIKKIRWEDDE